MYVRVRGLWGSMQRRTVIASIGAILGTSVGAAAYTSATVTRDATFTIATDSGTALIGLNAGSFDEITDTGDTLNVAIQNLNTGGTFTFGDDTSIETVYAFSITNNDGGERTISLGYDTAGVTFDVWQQGTDWTDATSVGVADDQTSVQWTAAASEAVHVIMTVDTTGVASGATDLDGTLTFTAN